jgi:multidrug efflux pump subunit AcrA (membrane-fusion protein)
MKSVVTSRNLPTDHRVDEGTEEAARAPSAASRRRRRRWLGPVVIAAGLVVAIGTAWATRERWIAQFAAAAPPGEAPHDAADGHDHAPASSSTIEISKQGRKNIGLTLMPVELRDFDRTIAVPAMLASRPGRTETTVSAPMTGIVTRIYPTRGEAVAPGDRLFDLRLTHEDLVEKQSTLLRAVEERDVVQREVERLDRVTSSGAVAGKALLERQYEQQKIEASIRADTQALVLHGLTNEQIEGIITKRQLLQTLTIAAPPFAEHAAEHDHDDFYQVTNLAVKQGEHVAAGAPLATLGDYCQLHIEGLAFEHDAPALNAAANAGTPVSALIEGGDSKQVVGGLKLLYVESQIELQSRALKFYVTLPNELVRNETTADGHRFVGWRYKPGQRVEVLVPVERWQKRIVLPASAVVQEGVENFVFVEKGSRFDRKGVHVEYRDRQSVVVANDGTLFPGDVVAANGAYQLHLALKAQAGGGPDPHAGHHH